MTAAVAAAPNTRKPHDSSRHTVATRTAKAVGGSAARISPAAGLDQSTVIAAVAGLKAPAPERGIDSRYHPFRPRMRASLVVVLVLGGCSESGQPAGRPDAAGQRDVAAPANIVEVDAGGFHTCVRLDDGGVECWGQCSRQCGMRPDGSSERLAVAGIGEAVELAVGDAHACARLADGEVACWGSNTSGGLGRTQPDDSAMPLLVPDVHGAVEIAIAGDLTCARLQDGTVSCWGAAAQDYDRSEAAAQARLPRRVEGLADAQSLAVTSTGACARTAAAATSCWGWATRDPDWKSRMEPARVDARKNGVVQSTHGTCDCDLDQGGAVHCRGSGVLSARLADGSSPPVQLHACPADGLTGVRTLADGCAIMTDGTVRCWGRMFFGRTGAAPIYDDLREPTAIDGITDARELAIGSKHVCVLSSGGKLACWGSNSEGQIDGRPNQNGVWPPRQIDRRPDP
jgi:hypothetical protein